MRRLCFRTLQIYVGRAFFSCVGTTTNVSIDGPEAAQNLEFVLQHEQLRGDYYEEHLIPRRATRLATRLYASLIPMLSRRKRKKNVLRKWEKETSQLVDIFKAAIRLKTKLLVSKNVIEVIFPSRGERYFKKYMNAPPHPKDPALVEVCLVPGLRIPEKTRMRSNEPSFFRAEIETDNPNCHFDLVVQAGVLLKEP